jgi:D-ribose pyranose/furanose isomerase RbsD
MLKTIQDLEKNQELLLKNMEVNFDKRLQVLENEVNSKEIILMNKIKEERTNLSSLLSNISSKLNED